ncbi:MAG: rhomboid family intramembrane serine protease [Nannocystaceae bacterium]|nr:rhomboid family intramembrane serine protease [Nannocystaceae bacterium]
MRTDAVSDALLPAEPPPHGAWASGLRAAAPRRLPWVTMSLCVPAIVLLASVQLGWLPEGLADARGVDLADAVHVVELGARSTALVGDASERWRLLTAHFVHTSWTHLLFNLAFLFPAGGAIEQIVRRIDYAMLVLVAAIGSALASLMFTPQVSAGASGIVFGVLGAAVVVGLRHRHRLGPRIRHHFGVWVLPFLLVTLAVTVGNPTVDHASHLGGLLAGMAFAPCLRLRLHAPIERSSAANVVAGTACAAALLCAPALARGGAAARVDLGHGWSADVPAQWDHRYGPLGELEWITAGGMVVMTAGEAPAPTMQPDAVVSWYREHRLAPLSAVGRTLDVRELPVQGPMPLPAGAIRARFAYRREQTPMIRDVVFVPAPQSARMLVVSLELPRPWAERYDETRTALLGSLRAPRPSTPRVTRISVAAIE